METIYQPVEPQTHKAAESHHNQHVCLLICKCNSGVYVLTTCGQKDTPPPSHEWLQLYILTPS